MRPKEGLIVSNVPGLGEGGVGGLGRLGRSRRLGLGSGEIDSTDVFIGSNIRCCCSE